MTSPYRTSGVPGAPLQVPKRPPCFCDDGPRIRKGLNERGEWDCPRHPLTGDHCDNSFCRDASQCAICDPERRALEEERKAKVAG